MNFWFGGLFVLSVRRFWHKSYSLHFTRVEAYWAFWQYCTPRVGFSVPALLLSQADCHFIQSPTLTATLSKLHLNEHTSWAIVFGLAKYGELALSELYTSAGLGQLCLFIGPLRLWDRSAGLILIDISYI